MLTLKHLPIKSFCENLAYIHKDCTIYKIDNIKSMTKIEIHGGKDPIYAFVQIVDGNKFIRADEIGLNTEAFKQINLAEGSKVSLTLTPPASSMAAVRRKIAGNILSSREYEDIINDIALHRYSNMDIAAFLVAIGSFITPPEILSLAEALRGERAIDWGKEEFVTGYCSFGDIPGNKVDIIVAAIVAAYGLPIPITIAKNITPYSTVADTMATLASIDLDIRALKKQIQEKRGAIVSSDSLGIAEADKMISAVEQQNGIATIERTIASILANKAAAGITNLLVDIPVGPKAKIRNTQEAMRIRKIIEYVADMLSITVDVVITDGSEPIGCGVGSALEARDIVNILKNKEDAPQDLKEKAIFLAGRILEVDPSLRGGQGYFVAKEILKTGKALDAFEQIIKEQGKTQPVLLGHLSRDVIADIGGEVKKIDNTVITQISVLAGAGQCAGAGIDLFKKVGDSVSAGDILYRIYSCNPNDFAFVSTVVESGRTGFEIS